MLGFLLLIINFAIAISAASLLYYTYPFRKWSKIRYLYVTNAGFFIMAFCTTQVLIQQDFATKVFFSRMRFLGIALLAPSYLIFASYTMDRMKWVQTRTAKILLYLPTVITITLTLVPEWRDYMVRDFVPFSYGGLDVLQFKGGFWFAFHGLGGYAEVTLFGLLCAWSAFKETGRLRLQAFVLLATVMLTGIFDTTCFVAGSPLRWVMLTTSLYGVNQFALLYSASVLGLTNVRDLAKQKIFDHVPYPIIAVDERGRMAGVNEAAQTTFGLGDQQVSFPFDQLLSTEQRTAGEVKIVKPNGDETFYSLSVVPLEKVGELYSYKEITKEKRVEQELIGLLSILSHDLAGTIHNQARLSDMVARKLSTEDTPLATALVQSSAANRDLIHNLVLWSNSQRDDLRREHRPVEINALVEDTIELTHSLCKTKNITLITAKADSVIVKGNAGMLSSVLRNFISNAIRASEAGAQIKIRTEISGQTVTVSVIDQGFGIETPEIRVADGSTGYGIGLKLGRRFIQQHGGTLVLEPNTNGVGTRASFTIPTLKS